MSNKIQPIHLQRLAVVYLRQSTMRQVVEHPESTRRQYALRERASQLGWPEAAIDVIDEDLGLSGADTTRRHGFRRLSEQVAEGRVGAIFAVEVSRLSRSSADWYRLLDLCGIADVVLVDEQAIYHPADPNDRLVLGIKGTMSEAERVWAQLRLRGARVSKARHGEYRMPTPVGYCWDQSTSRLRLDPDEEVQGALRASSSASGSRGARTGSCATSPGRACACQPVAERQPSFAGRRPSRAASSRSCTTRPTRGPTSLGDGSHASRW